MAILQAYTIDLLKEVEAESGQSIGIHMTGGVSVASAPERWEWPQSSYRRFQVIGIDDVRLVTLEVDALDADATGYEPVWRSGAIVGFVTSAAMATTWERAWRWVWSRRKRPRSAPS